MEKYNIGYNSNEEDCGDVAVIGVALRFPSGDLNESISKPNQLFNSLLNGFNGIVATSERWSDNYYLNGEINSVSAGLLPLDEWKRFDPIFFGINPSYDNVVTIDPQQRLLLKCVWEALEDSGIDPINLRGTNTSTFIGCSTTDYCSLQKSPFETQNNIFGSSNHSIANRIGYCFDFRGENFTIDSACSSSLNAINCGYNSIKSNKSNVSVVGGVNFILDPNTSKSFTQLNILSPTGKCHTFSSDADGYVRSEGVGIVVLKKLKDAIKDSNNIYCVIKGSSSNIDGNYDKLNFYSPSKSSQYENMKLAIKSTNGQINESDIDYCETHGTGTPTGDPIELEGISRLFNNNNKQVLVGSIKSNIGHTEACSGVASLIKCCLMFKNKLFLQNINFKEPNPLINFKEWGLKVVTEPIKFNENKTTVMLINNFGVTGSNVCLILSEFKDKRYSNNEYSSDNAGEEIDIDSKVIEKKKFLIPLSSNSSTSLDNYKSIITNNNDDDSNSSTISFQEFVYNQIKFKSTSLIQKSVIIASDWNEFQDDDNQIKLKNSESLISNITVEKKKSPLTVMVFCGQSSQYNRMALSLYENEPIFRESVDKFDKELFKYYGYSVLERLRSISDKDEISIHQPILAQPANIMIQISLYELYKHWGVSADIIVGHSLGEMSSSYSSGMIDFETLCYLIYHRSLAQNRTTGTGRMLSVNISYDEFIEKYQSKNNKYETLEIACYNSPTSIVIAGKENLLNEISKEFKSNDIFCAMLGSLSSFHTSSQLMIKDEVCSLMFKSKLPSVPVFSTVTTNLFNDQTPYNANYVWENIYQPVSFTQTISNLYKHIESNDMGNEITFIEVAPHPTLQFYLSQMKSIQSSYFNNGKNITIYSPLHKKKNDYNEFLKTISLLYVNNNFNINFKSQLTNINNNNINSNSNNNNNKMVQFNDNNLPLYQWDDKEYFKLNPFYEKIISEGPPIQNLGNSIDSACSTYQTFIDIKKPPFQWLKGHQVSDKFYYPGMGYVQNLLSIYPNQDITISSLEFKSPLVLTEGNSQCLETTVSPLSKNEFNVKSHYKDQKTNQWILSSLGNFSLFKHNSINSDKLINIQALKDKCNFTTISKQDFYEAIKIKANLTYKGLFQGVKECSIGSNCSLSIVSLNETNNHTISNHSTIGRLLFNAATLDSCLHGSLIAVVQPIVLDRIEGFKLYSSNIPSSSLSKDDNDNNNNIYGCDSNNNSNNFIKELYVYTEAKARTNYQSFSASVKIILPNGRLLMEISMVVCSPVSLANPRSSIICKPPSNEIYTPYLQPKDSIIDKPQQFKHLYSVDEFIVKEEDNQIISTELLLSLFYKYINVRCPTINLESLITLEYNQFKQLYYNDNGLVNENLFKFIFEILKSYGSSSNNNNKSENNKNINKNSNNDTIIFFEKLYNKTTKIIAKLLFPLNDDDSFTDTPQSLFENAFLDDFYKNSRVVQPLNNFLSEIIIETLKPILNQPIVFRILEAGGGTGSLSLLILEKICKLLNENPNSIIDIEFTWSDVSSSFSAEIKEKFSPFTTHKNFNIIHRVLDLEKPLFEQDLKPSYYDLVVMSNVMHVVRKLKPTLDEIHNILIPNGQLLFIEPPYKSIYYDSIMGCFSQWWPSSDSDTELRPDRCCMNQDKWIKLLNETNYRDTIISGNDNLIFLIQTRKPSINEIISKQSSESSLDQFNSFNNIILFGNNNNNNGCSIQNSISSNQELKSKTININNFNEFQTWITSNYDNSYDFDNNKTLIIFLKSIEPINISNFKEITYEYIQINQLILKLELTNSFKHLLLSLDSITDNYLSSSIIGAARSFVEFPQLDLYILNYDKISLKTLNNSSGISGSSSSCKQQLSLINYLINANNNIQKEFTINNNKVYYERYTRHSNKIKCNLQSKSFETNKDNLLIQLDSNLEYQLYSKRVELNSNEVEIEIKATGINYKDYLMYIGMVSSDLDLKYGKEYEVENGIGIENPMIGNDFSGIITRLGSDAEKKKFKVGDHVCGVASKTSGSHVVTDYNFIYHQPLNYNHSVSASIPSIYVTSLHSIYGIGNLKSNESILIHSAAGGIGISSLDLLKCKKHQGHIFLTVGSKDKEDYLIKNYGSFITAIYSSRNKDYVNEIKNKLIELGEVEQQGVHLILNTLSSEFMDSNFQCLNMSGRIVDLSVTHLTPNDYMRNNLYKYNMGYNNVEVIDFNGKMVRSYLKKIIKMINSNKLELSIPIIEYSNNQFKDAIEYINQRKHIGKIVVNHNQDEFNRVYNNYQQNNNNNQIIMKHSYDISKLNMGKNILLTGQTGIVLEIMKYLIRYSNHSIQNIIILSKSKLKWELELLINQTKFIKDNIIKFHFIQIDIEDSNKVNQVLNQLELNENITNIDSIIHFAFNNDIGDVQDVDMNRLNIAHGAKTIGAINLHNESINRSWKIKQFIIASSAASVISSDQQCCYVSACSVIDSLSKYRHSLGLPSLAINLGSVASTGFISRNNAIETMFKSSFLKLFSPHLVISSLDLFIQNQHQYPNYSLMDFNFEVMLTSPNYHLYKFDYEINIFKKSYQIKTNSSGGSGSDNEFIHSTILNKISELLSVDESKINEELQLTQYGMDSLVIVQLKNFIDNQLGHNLITIHQLQHNKINQSIDIIKFDPHVSKSFTQLNILSPTGKCHTFSSDADGYVRSEGVGIVILKKLKDAIKDSNNIYCVIKGSSSNVDGNYDKLNFYSPSKSSQYENMKLAIKSTNGQINESDIDYCEAHGTGTPTGDPIELEGISRLFNNNNNINNKQVLVGSIKSNIGHTEGKLIN
ncbi:hypothetical protein ACTFIW_008600 [Dictyostelium discoideum]